MMYNKNKKFKTINIYKDDEDEKLPKKERILMKVSAEYVQQYGNTTAYVIGLSSVHSFHFMNWVMFYSMDENNVVDVSMEATRNYIESLKGRVPDSNIPTIRTLRRSVSELVQARILLKTGRGSYMMNPAIFWKGSMQLRQKSLSMFIAAGISLNPGWRLGVEEAENHIKQSPTELEGSFDGTSNI